MKLMKNFGKCVLVLAAVAMVFGAVSAQAKSIQLFEKGVDMMLKSKDTIKGGMDTIEKGMGQYVQICTDKGCLTDVNTGNDSIKQGMAQGKQGMALLDQGQKEFQVCKANRNLEGEYRCLDTFTEGGRLVQDGLKTIEGGMRSNNAALRAKGLDKDTSAPSTMINKGVESALVGMREFLNGQRLALENR
jgi:hypothetical protein